MNPDQLLRTALQYGKERNHKALVLHLRRTLWEHRPVATAMLQHLLAHTGEHIKDAVFEAILGDGGSDLMPHLVQLFQTTKEPHLAEQRLSRLAHHPAKEALDLVENLVPILGKEFHKPLRRTLGTLRARFRQYFYLRAFEKGTGKQLKEAADAMLKGTHKDYLQLAEYLETGSPEKCREAVRVLERIPDRKTLPALIDAIERLIDEDEKIQAFSELPFLHDDPKMWHSQKVLECLAERPEHPLQTHQIPSLLSDYKKGVTREDLEKLLQPYPLSGQAHALARSMLIRLITGRGDLTHTGVIDEHIKNLREEYRDALRQMALSGARLAEKLGFPDMGDRIAEKLSGHDAWRDILMVWYYAGTQTENGKAHLLERLHNCKDEATLKNVLHALTQTKPKVIPAKVLMLAKDPKRHSLRHAALGLLASSPAGPPHLSRLLAEAPLLIKDDVGAVIERHKIKDCQPTITRILETNISDSFRMILLKTLEPFDDFKTGLAVRDFLLPLHSISVRLTALQTLFRAGGPHKIHWIVKSLQEEKDKRHSVEIPKLFLDELLRSETINELEPHLLKEKDYFEELLHFPDNEIRFKALKVLELFAWESEHRQGWVGILQKSLQTMVAHRTEEESALLETLIERISALFESARKKQVLQKRLGTIANSLENKSRMERIQALKQLDWIYRPEMVQGDPEGVRRLVKRIEYVMKHDKDDPMIEVLAIEVAGKIGHPALRQKIKEYVNHDNEKVAIAAVHALSQPVNEILLEHLIQRIFHIDDSSYMTRLVSVILQKEGYEAVGANDPKDALDLLRQADYDLLILDLNMPKMCGVEFLRSIRRMEISPRFTFVLTSVRNQDDLTEVFHEGVDGVLLKPFNAEDLLERIKELKEKCI